MKKHSDSDYKAEDQGSASDTLTKKKVTAKKNLNVQTKMNKKEVLEFLSSNFLPEGMQLDNQDRITKAQYQQLKQTQDAPEFTLNYKVFLGKIVKVTDGDTFKAVIFLNGIKSRFTFRIDGLDTPQTRKGQAKQFGKKVKQVVTQMIGDKMVKIQAGGFDKYGRVLSRIYTYSQGKVICLNQFLVQNDMAKPYFGKTKVEFTNSQYQNFKEKYSDVKWPITVDFPLIL